MTEPTEGFAVLDVETTGLFPARGDRIVEVAVVRTTASGHAVDEWATLVNPGRAVAATRIHGLTSVDVRRAPTFAQILGELNGRLAGKALVAHNIPFDLAFLELEYARAGWTLPEAPCLCTLHESQYYLPGLSRHRLSACCAAAGIVLEDSHTALGDARATAALLCYYLNAGRGPGPLPDHLELPRIATATEWPAIPRSGGATPVPRGISEGRPPATAPGTLARLLNDLPTGSAQSQTAAIHASGYLELLADVLEDGVLTESEASALVGTAERFSLTRPQVEAVHRDFLLQLAQRVVRDGKVTRDERRDLLATAEALGMASDIAKTILVEARTAIGERLGATSEALPETWDLGEPLRVGDRVAFTGCGETERARLEGRAQAAGLRVVSSVSRKTAILVTDGGDPTTAKARTALQYGTRVVDPNAFAIMVKYVQPATGKGATPRSPASPPRGDRQVGQADAGGGRPAADRHVAMETAEQARRVADCLRARMLIEVALSFCEEPGELARLRTLAAEHDEYLASLPPEVVGSGQSIVDEEEHAAERRCAEEERDFAAAMDTIRRALDEHHSQVQADRKAGIVGTQTELGRTYGLTSVAVGRILDAHGLRERVEVDVDGVPEHLEECGGIFPPLFGTRFVPVEGGRLRQIRGIVDGFAVHDPFDGRDYWIAAKVAPLLAPHSSR